MAKKYLQDDGGGSPKSTEFTQSSSGAANAGDPIAANSQGKLDETWLPDGLGPEVLEFYASETIDLGLDNSRLVNLYWDEIQIGTLPGGDPILELAVVCRLADVAGKPAHGFIKSSVTAGNYVKIYFDGIMPWPSTAVSIDGSEAVAYLGENGEFALPRPALINEGDVWQEIGVATSAGVIFRPIKIATK